MDGENKFYLLVLALVIIATVLGLMNVYDFGLTTGSGERVGYIPEVSNSGIFWHPTEVRLLSIEPTYSEEDTSCRFGVGNEWEVSKARMYSKTHQKVVITYEEVAIVPYWEYSHRVIITSIQAVIE